MRKLSFLALAFALFCPIAHTQHAAATPATATIVFYRLREAYGALLKPSIFCDQKQVARMRNGRFFSITVPVGSHTITSTLPGSGSIIDAKPGEIYYIRLEISKPAMFHGGRGAVTQVEPGQGKFESAQLKPAEPEDSKPEESTSK